MNITGMFCDLWCWRRRVCCRQSKKDYQRIDLGRVIIIMLTSEQTAQVVQILSNLDAKNKKVPYLQDLQEHTIFGQFFLDLDADQKQEVEQIIQWYIKSKIEGLSTKWGEFFRRFYNLNKDSFRLFRELNMSKENIETADFQDIGKELEQELFKFENMLTQNMGKRSYGLDKVVSAFYDIVHSFFPWFSFVK